MQNGTENRNLRETAQTKYSDTDRQAQAEAEAAGVKLRIVTGAAIQTVAEVNGTRRLVKSRGVVTGDEAIVRGDDKMFTSLQITRHETAHKRIERGEIDLGNVVRTLKETVPMKKIRQMVALYSSAYADSGMTGAEVLEEIICDAMGEMNAFATKSTSSVAGEVGVFLRKVQKAVQDSQSRTEGAKNPTGEGGVKYNREMTGRTQKEITQRYQQEVDQVLNSPYTNARQLIVGYTPTVYRELGMPSLPLTIGSGHVYSAAKTEAEAKQDGNYRKGTHYHGLGGTALKNIYKAIQDPVMVIAAKDVKKNASPLRSTHSVVAIVDIGTAGKSLLVPIEITAERTVNGTQMDVNTISSLYEKNVENLVREAIALENAGDIGVYYAKKEAMTLPVAGVQFPTRLQQSIASNGIIHRFSEKVNMNILENVQSQQFKRWFGDWQNDPENASKIVNADGTPKVMYHGTNGEFTVFDRSKGKKKIHLNVLGDGNYFTAREQGAARYGSNVIAAYLNIRNPYVKADGFNTVADQIASEFDIPRSSFTGKDVSSILQNRGYDGVVMYDGNGEIVIANAFNSNQIKSATDNIGTFDGTNTDIRYSREMDTVAALERQNKILRQQKEHWKNQARSTQGHRKADAMEVRRLCRQIVSEYSSTTKATEIAEGMQWLADQWADPKADAGYGAMSDYAVELARQIVAGSEVDLNADMAEIRQELTGYLRSTPIHITESIKAGIPDFADFKKRNRTLRFREDGSGTAVDSMWLELQDMFGTGMFPESIMNPEDQVRYIAETLEDMREVLVNPYGVEMELAVQQLANDLLWRTSQLNPEKPTRVDAAVERATREMQTLLEEGRERENRRISQAQDTQQRQRIRKVGEQFRRMVERPGRADSQHAPAGLAKAAMEICEILNDSELRRMDRWERALERRADALGNRAAGLGDFAPAVMYQEFDAIENSQRRQTEIKAKLSDLQSRYAAMAADARFQETYDETVANMIGSVASLLNGTDIGALRGWELKQIANTMQALHHTITNANRAFSMGKNREISEMSQKFAQQMRQGNHAASGIAVAGRRYWMHQMSPDTFFDYLCGFAKNNEGRNIQAAFVRGEERMLEIQRDFGEFFREFTESRDKATVKELRNLMNYSPKRLISWGLRDRAGNEVKTTRGMMMQAYMMLQQKDSLESLSVGGFTIPNAEAYYGGRQSEAYGDTDLDNMMSQSIGSGAMALIEQRKQLLEQLQNARENLEIAGSEKVSMRYRQQIGELEKQVRSMNQQLQEMTTAAMERLTGMREGIEQLLTPLERRLIEKAHEWYSYSGELMGDVFEQMYGYRPTLVENYVPIHRDPSTIKTDIRDMGGAEKAFNLENSGFTKERIRNYQPILLTDFFTELMSQKGKISRYVGFAQVQKDFGKIWKCRIGHGNDTVATTVRSIYGSGQRGLGISGEAYIENYIADIAGGHQSDDILGAFYGNYAAATLRLNPRVAASQAASIPTMASVVGWKSMAVGMGKGFGKAFSKKFRNELAAKNAFFYQRYKGEGGSTELSDLQLKGNVIERIANSRYGKALFNWCQIVDVWSTGAMMWYAAEDRVKSSGMKPGSQGYEAEVNRVYTDIIRRSQPNYTTTERSALLRDKRAHMKLLTMFKTQSNQNLNLLVAANGRLLRAQQDLKKGRNGVTAADVKAAKTEVANAATGVLIGGTVAFVGIRTIMNFIMGMLNPYRDEETDEVTWQAAAEGITKEIISSMAGMVSLGGQVYDVANALISGDKFYGLSDSAVTSLSGAVEDTITVLQKGGEASEKQLWNMVNSWSMTFGIPSGNAKKIYNAFKMYIEGFTTGDWDANAGTTASQYRARVAKYVLAGDKAKAADALAAWFASSTKDTDEEARKDMAQSMRTYYVKNRYISGELTELEAEKLMRYTGTENPEKYLQQWDFEMEVPGESYSEKKAKAYYDRGDLPADVLLEAWNFAQNAQADKDKKGKSISGSKKQKIVDYIQALPNLSKSQKKRLFELLDAGSIKGTPWE